MGSISLREFIRWLPDDASEPTSTIVVTSPGRHFVDIRVLRPKDSSLFTWPEGEERVPVSQLDWAIAGTSESWPAEDGTDAVTHGRWNHWIDSRVVDTEGVADEGTNYPAEGGKTLEKGRMLNPDTGKETDYEELWRDLEVDPTARSAVLHLDKGQGLRGSVVLAGNYCQGILRKGESITAERWQRDGARGGWRRSIVIGDGELPCSGLLEQQYGSLVPGGVVTVGSEEWTVTEARGF